MIVTEQITARTAQLSPALQQEVLDFVDFLVHRTTSEVPPEKQALVAQLRAQGYQHFGVFADDPEALEVFDEIERERNQHTIGA